MLYAKCLFVCAPQKARIGKGNLIAFYFNLIPDEVGAELHCWPRLSVPCKWHALAGGPAPAQLLPHRSEASQALQVAAATNCLALSASKPFLFRCLQSCTTEINHVEIFFPSQVFP